MRLVLRRRASCGSIIAGVCFAVGLYAIASPCAAEPSVSGNREPKAEFTVKLRDIIDYKSVLATVKSRDLIKARVRTPGTITVLTVDEGTQVRAGQKIATIKDDKLELRAKGMDARITALETQVSNARAELARTRKLVRRKVSPQTRLEQAQTTFRSAEGELKAARAERAVIQEQSNEGQVLAPADGRVLNVPVTLGSVVLPGESIATIAANEFILRLQLPERHARFMKAGDEVRIGPRGLGAISKPRAHGRIVQVYPQLSDGRVIADAKVDGLGSYFIGERALVWISAGSRKAILIPRNLVFQRFSLDYVRLKADDGSTIDVVVQLGDPSHGNDAQAMVEVLAGLRPGDALVAP